MWDSTVCRIVFEDDRDLIRLQLSLSSDPDKYKLTTTPKTLKACSMPISNPKRVILAEAHNVAVLSANNRFLASLATIQIQLRYVLGVS